MDFVLYGHSITLITFVICARWTGDIYYPHIKLSDCPYVRIHSTATQLMRYPLFKYNLLTLICFEVCSKRYVTLP